MTFSIKTFLARLLLLGGVAFVAETSGTSATAADPSPEMAIADFYSTSTPLVDSTIQQCSCGSSSCGGCGADPKTCDETFMDFGIADQSCDSGGLFAGHRKDADNRLPWWAHRTSTFGEYLYLTAGSSDLIYAIEGTDPDPAVSTPTGPIGIVQMAAESGFRTGFSIAASPCSSLNFAYSRWDGQSSDVFAANDGAGFVLNSQLLHPSLDNAGVSSLVSEAEHKMAFQTIDLNYRHLWKQSGALALNWTAGLRYSNLEQTLNSQQTFQVANGLTDVTTQIDFEGFGLTGGLDLERYSCETGLFIYGKGMTSLLAGDWQASYRQVNQFGGGEPANAYEDFHATPILEGEIGLGWQSGGGKVRLQSGYMMAGWYEAVSTRGYIDAVRNNRLIDIGETITFSGLTSRLTVLF